MNEGMRIDKWLWAVRFFKTRNQASAACKAGKVRLGGQFIKASREVKAGDELSISQKTIIKTVRILKLPENRIGAALVPEYIQDLTPESEYSKVRMIREANYEYRDPGIGRPTKRHRREIEALKNYLGE
jgi:ribosome-associated heat shock protein Hsp15